ncbi:hypothetical protein M406DRAFT_53693, partial [Cryphonectria parasitica EP155]
MTRPRRSGKQHTATAPAPLPPCLLRSLDWTLDLKQDPTTGSWAGDPLLWLIFMRGSLRHRMKRKEKKTSD